LLGEGRVRLDGPPEQVFACTAELASCGILAPPLARLQTELLGEIDEVLLTVDELAVAIRPWETDRAAKASAPRSTAGHEPATTARTR
jgi:hypothetical protein